MVPRATVPRPRKATSTAAILAAALTVLRERGYERLTLDEVAGVAGVGKSSLYARFGSKADLAAAALASLQRDPPPSGGGLRADLVAQLRALERGLGAAGAQLVGALLLQTPAREPRHAAAIASLTGHLRRRLEQAVGAGELAPEADLSSAAGLLVSWLLIGGAASGEGDPAGAVDLVLRGLGGGLPAQGSGNG